MTTRQRFEGAIAGVGTTSGVRVVVGRWSDTPLGPFGDAMVQRADGHRVLIAPHQEAAGFIAATYTFDEVRIEPVAVASTPDGWSLRSASLTLDLVVGRRSPLGRLLGLLPRAVSTAPWFCAVTDPVARVVMRGVRTRGTAGRGRREWYGATDHHVVESVTGSFDGLDLGSLHDVLPAPTFGFSSTPPRPSVTAVVTTVETSA
ncbi:MAG: hypothetical protein F2667_02490 [Actinobacteria bacterium]|uniref:Unannotated protein n=1 Tax=freshwater metagenome TaxID=449393 RepID=A0A6J6NZQ0_9ZZZZ|nr:hypothetical protein [Actinomycetota bacterium]